MEKKLIEIRKKLWDIFDSGKISEEEYSYMWERLERVRKQVKNLNKAAVIKCDGDEREALLKAFLEWGVKQKYDVWICGHRKVVRDFLKAFNS